MTPSDESLTPLHFDHQSQIPRWIPRMFHHLPVGCVLLDVYAQSCGADDPISTRITRTHQWLTAPAPGLIATSNRARATAVLTAILYNSDLWLRTLCGTTPLAIISTDAKGPIFKYSGGGVVDGRIVVKDRIFFTDWIKHSYFPLWMDEPNNLVYFHFT